LNLGPSGYEPDELPDCSTPRHRIPASVRYANRPLKRLRGPLRPSWTRSTYNRPSRVLSIRGDAKILKEALLLRATVCSRLGRPGSDLLSRVLRHSTISAGELNDRVRNGIGWGIPAKTTRSAKPTENNNRSSVRSSKLRLPIRLRGPTLMIGRHVRRHVWVKRVLKPIEQLVPVSCSPHGPSTPGLST
jgi:hypothetical protein